MITFLCACKKKYTKLAKRFFVACPIIGNIKVGEERAILWCSIFQDLYLGKDRFLFLVVIS